MHLVDENDAVLLTACPEFDFASNTLADRTNIVDSMVATMKANNGIGLAAPQIGESIRLFVMLDDGKPVVCFNAEILQQSSETIVEYEGCLSFPDLWLKLPRSEWVIGTYMDINGDQVTRRFDGILSRCFMHELEHLNGVCFVSKVGPVKLAMATKLRKKKQRMKKNGTKEI